MPALPEPFDHAVVVCNDLDAAAANWRALGFTLTPRGYHTLGSQNHCIMLGRDYLELLHVTELHGLHAVQTLARRLLALHVQAFAVTLEPVSQFAARAARLQRPAAWIAGWRLARCVRAGAAPVAPDAGTKRRWLAGVGWSVAQVHGFSLAVARLPPRR